MTVTPKVRKVAKEQEREYLRILNEAPRAAARLANGDDEDDDTEDLDEEDEDTEDEPVKSPSRRKPPAPFRPVIHQSHINVIAKFQKDTGNHFIANCPARYDFKAEWPSYEFNGITLNDDLYVPYRVVNHINREAVEAMQEGDILPFYTAIIQTGEHDQPSLSVNRYPYERTAVSKSNFPEDFRILRSGRFNYIDHEIMVKKTASGLVLLVNGKYVHTLTGQTPPKQSAGYFRTYFRMIMQNVSISIRELFDGVPAIVNDAHIPVVVDRDKSGKGRFESFYNIRKKSRIVFTASHYESIEDFDDDEYIRSREEFVAEWTESATKNARMGLDIAKKRSDKLRKNYLEAIETTNRHKMMLDVLMSGIGTLLDRAMGSIEKIPGIIKVNFTKGKITAWTDDVWYDVPKLSRYKEGPRAYIGRFSIQLDLLRTSLSFVNLNMQSNVPQAHADNLESGDICMGGYETLFISAMELMDYESVFRLMMELFANVDENDAGARRRLEQLPPVLIESGKVSQRIYIYGESEDIPRDDDEDADDD